MGLLGKRPRDLLVVATGRGGPDHESHGFLVGECVPEAVGGEEGKVVDGGVDAEGEDVGLGGEDVLVLERVVAEGAGGGEDALDAPHAVERDEPAVVLDALLLFELLEWEMKMNAVQTLMTALNVR